MGTESKPEGLIGRFRYLIQLKCAQRMCVCVFCTALAKDLPPHRHPEYHHIIIDHVHRNRVHNVSISKQILWFVCALTGGHVSGFRGTIIRWKYVEKLMCGKSVNYPQLRAHLERNYSMVDEEEGTVVCSIARWLSFSRCSEENHK